MLGAGDPEKSAVAGPELLPEVQTGGAVQGVQC